MRYAIPLLLLAALALGANGPADNKLKLDPKEAEALAKALDGKVAGTPVTCVSAMRGQNLRVIGDHTLLYQVGKRVYRNDVLGSCTGLSWGDTLVMDVRGSQYCRGDIARVVNLPSGSQSGSCALGDFVPYDEPGK